MIPAPATFPWPDPNFHANQEKFPFEERCRYIGQFVAWSWDGSRLLTAGKTEDEVYQKLTETGCDPQYAIISYIDDPDVSWL